MKIKVTQEDIDASPSSQTKRDWYANMSLDRRCPIMRALDRTQGRKTSAVHRQSYTWTGDYWLSTPDDARAFVIAFDEGKPVQPAEFDL